MILRGARLLSPETVDWRNNWRTTSFRDQEGHRLQVIRANGTPLPKPRALVRFRPGASAVRADSAACAASCARASDY
jgi:hypothetical protein